MRCDERTTHRPFAHAVCGLDGSAESLVAVRQAKAMLEQGGTIEVSERVGHAAGCSVLVVRTPHRRRA